MQFRAIPRPESINLEQRTLEVTWTTGARGRRWSWSGDFMEELDVTEQSVRLERLNNGAPFLNLHSQWDLDKVIGVVERAWIENGQGVALIRFSEREEVEPIWKDVASGILRNISVGYIVHRYEVQDEEDNKLPVYRAMDWEPTEISLVPVGFDDGAKVRSQGAATPHQTQVITRAKAPTQPENPMPEPVQEPSTTPPADPVNVADIEKRAIEAERKRATSIRSMAAKVGLSDADVEPLITEGITTEQASTRMIDLLAERQSSNQPETRNAQPTGGLNTGLITQQREAMQAALLHRCAPSAHPLTEAAREFRGMRLIDLARECIQAVGGNARGLSQSEIAKAALGCDRQAMRAAGMHTTSDFPLLLGTTVNRTLRAAYDLAPQTWRPLGRQVSVPDFRAVTRVALGDIAALEKVNESGEYQYGTLDEEGVPLKVGKFGKIIAISWESVVNDDLGALTRLPAMLGQAAAQTESDTVWNLILSNLNYSVDGQPVFSAVHGNLAASGGAINTTTLAAARASMRKQKSKADNFLNLAPEFLVVGPDKELEAFQFTSSQYVPAKNADINDSRNASLTVVVDARITGNQWYLFAAPGLIDTFEYAYLDSEPGVFTETREGFDVDGMQIKARLVFGAAIIDYRGLYKNPGN